MTPSQTLNATLQALTLMRTSEPETSIAEHLARTETYYTARAQAETQFKAELASLYLPEGTSPIVARTTYTLAYSQGYSEGYSSVESHYKDIAKLVNIIIDQYIEHSSSRIF